MCEAAVYLFKDGREELVLESIDLIECEDGRIKLINIFGERMEIAARIKSLSLVDHKIIMAPYIGGDNYDSRYG